MPCVFGLLLSQLCLLCDSIFQTTSSSKEAYCSTCRTNEAQHDIRRKGSNRNKRTSSGVKEPEKPRKAPKEKDTDGKDDSPCNTDLSTSSYWTSISDLVDNVSSNTHPDDINASIETTLRDIMQHLKSLQGETAINRVLLFALIRVRGLLKAFALVPEDTSLVDWICTQGSDMLLVHSFAALFGYIQDTSRTCTLLDDTLQGVIRQLQNMEWKMASHRTQILQASLNTIEYVLSNGRRNYKENKS